MAMLKASKRLLESSRPLIFGMIHVPSLPGFVYCKLL